MFSLNIFLGPTLARWCKMKIHHGFGAEVTYMCKMDPLYGDIVSGSTVSSAISNTSTPSETEPQHCLPYFFGECQMGSYIHSPTFGGESPYSLVNLRVPGSSHSGSRWEPRLLRSPEVGELQHPYVKVCTNTHIFICTLACTHAIPHTHGYIYII